MSDLRDLYQETILDHNKHPQNFREMEQANRHAEGFNPLCGDRVQVYLFIQDGVVKDVSFKGAGCAICMASCSLMTSALKGKTEKEVENIFTSFHELVAGEADFTEKMEELGKLAVFQGVRDYPIRVKCATLPWHTLRAALHDQDKPVSTEQDDNE
ncbi:SUF system NifU family Fe-S cluster assembly protein [bacterium]|nr:SUF system NifU family Fe-S cluster assembly protein [bacterium]